MENTRGNDVRNENTGRVEFWIGLDHLLRISLFEFSLYVENVQCGCLGKI